MPRESTRTHAGHMQRRINDNDVGVHKHRRGWLRKGRGITTRRNHKGVQGADKRRPDTWQGGNGHVQSSARTRAGHSWAWAGRERKRTACARTMTWRARAEDKAGTGKGATRPGMSRHRADKWRTGACTCDARKRDAMCMHKWTDQANDRAGEGHCINEKDMRGSSRKRKQGRGSQRQCPAERPGTANAMTMQRRARQDKARAMQEPGRTCAHNGHGQAKASAWYGQRAGHASTDWTKSGQGKPTQGQARKGPLQDTWERTAWPRQATTNTNAGQARRGRQWHGGNVLRKAHARGARNDMTREGTPYSTHGRRQRQGHAMKWQANAQSGMQRHSNDMHGAGADIDLTAQSNTWQDNARGRAQGQLEVQGPGRLG